MSLLAVIVVFAFTGCFGGKKELRTCALFLATNSTTLVERTDYKNEDEVQLRSIDSIDDIATTQVFMKIEETLSKRQDLKILNRNRVAAIKDEQAFTMSDFSNADKMSKIGEAFNAKIAAFVYVYKDTYKVEFFNFTTMETKTFTGNYSRKLFSDRVNVKSLSKLSKFKISDIDYKID